MCSDGAPPGVPTRRLYGRGAGRRLSARRERLFHALLPALAPPDGPIDLKALAPEATGAALEIGFGGGEHLFAQAAARPDWVFLGVEPFVDGVGKALALAEDTRAGNVRLIRGDGRDVLDRIVPGSLDVIFLLFPDPWPKTRHHKRRFIQAESVTAFARALAPGGLLRVATDVRSYVSWTLEHVRAHGAFVWTARGPSDWRDAPNDHHPTRYETKNIGDCSPTYLDFRRV